MCVLDVVLFVLSVYAVVMLLCVCGVCVCDFRRKNVVIGCVWGCVFCVSRYLCVVFCFDCLCMVCFGCVSIVVV